MHVPVYVRIFLDLIFTCVHQTTFGCVGPALAASEQHESQPFQLTHIPTYILALTVTSALTPLSDVSPAAGNGVPPHELGRNRSPERPVPELLRAPGAGGRVPHRCGRRADPRVGGGVHAMLDQVIDQVGQWPLVARELGIAGATISQLERVFTRLR